MICLGSSYEFMWQGEQTQLPLICSGSAMMIGLPEPGQEKEEDFVVDRRALAGGGLLCMYVKHGRTK